MALIDDPPNPNPNPNGNHVGLFFRLKEGNLLKVLEVKKSEVEPVIKSGL